MRTPAAALLLTLIATACSQEAPSREGPAGPMGPPGPQGERGDRGPAGEVLLPDGGTIIGPAGPRGASATVTPVSPGATCPHGGVRVGVEDAGSFSIVCNGEPGAVGPAGARGEPGEGVQLADVDGGTCPNGGVALSVDGGQPKYVCHGAQGPAGPKGAQGAAGPQGAQGPAGSTGTPGPMGMQGPQGIAGQSATSVALAVGDASCPHGGTRFTVGSVVTYACNGAPGPMGPPGPPASGDGGYVNNLADGYTFAGFTASTYTGDLGGVLGANQKCQVEFSGSYFCTEREYQWIAPAVPTPIGGAWIDDAAYPSQYSPILQPRDRGGDATCNHWRDATGYHGGYLGQDGYRTNESTACATARPLTCCRSRKAVFRGFTSASYDGNLGGVLGANLKCHASFPGSHFCTEREYQWAGVSTSTPAGGAWIDDAATPTQYSPSLSPRDRSGNATCNHWRAASGYHGGYLDDEGYRTSQSTACATPRRLACCG